MKLLTQKRLSIFTWLIIIAGILLRIVFYLQNRNLFIDEANVARNIYERSYAELLQPLSYEQYAPPLFLWILKTCTVIAGFSEFTFRIFPLLCGIATLLLMYAVLKKYTNTHNSIWYPLLIIASGFIYIRYATEVKQYMCDAMVALLLTLTALNMDIAHKRPVLFFLLWCLAGTIAIWLSMPSVFILAGVGCYYIFLAIRQKEYTRLLMIGGISIVWLAQFYLYYKAVLKQQIGLDYLQNCHKDYFLFLLPNTVAKLNGNIEVLDKVLTSMGGKWTLSITFHLVTFAVGIICLLRRHTAKALLLIVPIVTLLIAAGLHQYSLISRLVLFIMPVIFIGIAVGLERLLSVRFMAVKVIVIIVAAICIINFNSFDVLYERHDTEQITSSLLFLQQQHIRGDHLFVHDQAGPAYIYYTAMHPDRDKWASLRNATILHWNSNYDSLAQTFQPATALLYSWEAEDKIAPQQEAIKRYHKVVAQNIVTGSRVYIYGN